MNIINPNEKLHKRGIEQSAFDAGWQDADYRINGVTYAGWKFPLHDPLTGDIVDMFWKNADSSQKGKKYRPFNGALSDHYATSWYVPNVAKTMGAIKDKDGLLWIANGAPSLLAMRAAGVNNSIAGRAETRIPDKLLYVLQKWGVTRVLYPVDNDETGHKVAAKWREALRGSGIDFVALSWGQEKRGYDANDAWIDSEFESLTFCKMLDSLNELELPALKPKVEPQSHSYDDHAELNSKIGQALGIQHYTSEGWSVKKIHSPFRDEKNPSFNFNIVSGVGRDWGTDENYSPYQLAKQLGIDYDPPPPKKPKQAKPTTPPPIEYLYENEAMPGRSQSWLDNQYLPHDWIRATLTLSDSRSAVTIIMLKLHHAFRTGQLDYQSFTLKQVTDCLATPRASTKAAIETLHMWGFVRHKAPYIESNYKGDYPVQNLYANADSVSNGRPAQVYCIVRDPYHLPIMLADKLDYYVIERHTSKALAPRIHTLVQSMELDANNMDDIKEWGRRIDKLVSHSIHYKIESDLRHWHDRLLIDDPHSDFEYDLEDIDNISLRAQILTYHLNQHPEGVQMSHDEVMLLLGLKSNTAFKDIYKEGGIVSEQRQVWEEVSDPNTAHIEDEIKVASRPGHNRRGGVVMAMTLKDYGGKWLKHWAYRLTKNARNLYSVWEEHRGMIDDLRLIVKLPCFLRFETEKEREDRMKEEMVQEKQVQETEYVAIVGSRNFPDLDQVHDYIRALPQNAVVVSGGARGVDQAAETEARKCGLEVISIPAEWEKYGKSAGVRRNHDIINKATRVIAFWHNDSKGTAHSIRIAREQNKPIKIIRSEMVQKDIEQVGIEHKSTDESVPNSSVESDLAMDIAKPKKKRLKRKYSTKADRAWDRHDKAWLCRQMQAEVYCWLNLCLHESGEIKDKNGQLIVTITELKELVLWIGAEIARRGISEPFHYADEFFDSDVLDFEIKPKREYDEIMDYSDLEEDFDDE